MKIALNSELQKLVDIRVKSGQYASAEQVVAAALVALDQQERFGDFEPGELSELLAEGERSIVQKGTLDGDEAYQERCAARARARKRAQ